jgi:hypothetical protein
MTEAWAAIHAVKVLPWGLSISNARYYGYRWALHIGPWLIFVARVRIEEAGK